MWKLSVRVQLLIGLALISAFLLTIGVVTVLVLRSAELSFNRLVQGAVPASYDALGAAHTGSQIANDITALTASPDEYARQAYQIALQQKLTLFRQHLDSLESVQGDTSLFNRLSTIADNIEAEIREINVLVSKRMETQSRLDQAMGELSQRWLILRETVSDEQSRRFLDDEVSRAVAFFRDYPHRDDPQDLVERYLRLVRPAELLAQDIIPSGGTPVADLIHDLQPTSEFTEQLIEDLSARVSLHNQIGRHSKTTRELSNKLSIYVTRVVRDANIETASNIESTRERIDRARWAMFLLFSGALFLVIPAIWYFVVFGMIRPIGSLSRLAKNLGEGQLFTETPKIPPNEIGDLGDALILARNTMQKLQQTNVELADKEEKLEKLATTDPLTGSFNRRYFENVGSTEILRSLRTGRPFCVAMLDLDRFKELNDTFGHQIGDKALVQTVETTVEIIRTTDVLARWGGEEFAILFAEAAKEQTAPAAERIREKLAEVEIGFGEDSVQWTVSIGLAEWRSEDEDIRAVISRADEALYLAKNLGRNRVVIY